MIPDAVVWWIHDRIEEGRNVQGGTWDHLEYYKRLCAKEQETLDLVENWINEAVREDTNEL